MQPKKFYMLSTAGYGSLQFLLFSSIFSNFSEFAYNSLIIKVCIFYLGDPANFGGYVCS